MKEIEEYANKASWRLNGNANWNFSHSGMQAHIAGTELAKDTINIFGKIGKRHLDGDYHLHNLEGGRYGRYCSGNDLMKLLQNGLYNPIGVSAKPAKHLGTAIDHLVNMTYILTGEWQGAQAWVAPDILLAPYIWKDRLSYEQVKQEVQRMIWAFSFPMRPNYQTPFCNLTFGLRPSKYFKQLVPFIGDETLPNNIYDDFQNEIDMFNRAFLDVMIEGANGTGFTFPLPTYNITKDFKWLNMSNPESVEYKIFELAATWGSPYFSNYVNSGLSEDDQLAMCCRLRINLKEVQRASGGLWNFGNNTGSLAVFNINMPRIGYLSNGNERRFYKLLDQRLEDSKKYLLKKKEFIKEGNELGLFPMSENFIGDKMLETYFLTIGHTGLNECSVNFCDQNILENIDWCENVLKYMHDKILQMQIDTGHLFNFEAVPGEGSSYSLARIDKEKFDDIFTQGTDDAPYYTGSSMIPTNISMYTGSALRYAERLQKHYTGGTIFHIDEGIEYEPKAIATYIKYVFENYTLPYVTWSPTYMQCEIHGKSFGKVQCCDKANTYTRVVGYYRPVGRFNIGKKQEFAEKQFMRR